MLLRLIRLLVLGGGGQLEAEDGLLQVGRGLLALGIDLRALLWALRAPSDLGGQVQLGEGR